MSWNRYSREGRACLYAVALGVWGAAVGCQPSAPPVAPSGSRPPAANSTATPGSSKVTSTEKSSSASNQTPSTEAAAKPATEPSGSSESNPTDSRESKPAADGAPASAEKTVAKPAPRRPRLPGQPEEISFDDLVIGMQADIVFRPWMLSDRVKEIDGQSVRLIGYVHPGVETQKHIKELVLLRNLECKFGPGGQADHLVRVTFKPGVEASFTKNAVEVQGVLKINPFQGADGNTWSIYDLEGTGFKDLRRK